MAMPAPDARQGLVLVAREVTRSTGKKHTQHFWVKPEDVQPGDKQISDPQYIKDLDERQARNKEITRRWREAKKLNGTATPPDQPPPPPAPPAPIKEDAPDPTKAPTRSRAEWLKSLSPEERLREEMIDRSPTIQEKQARLDGYKKELANRLKEHPQDRWGMSQDLADDIKLLEERIEKERVEARAVLAADKGKKLPLLPPPKSDSLGVPEDVMSTVVRPGNEIPRAAVKHRLEMMDEFIAKNPVEALRSKAGKAAAAECIRHMAGALSNTSRRLNEAVALPHTQKAFLGRTPPYDPSNAARAVAHFEAEDNLSSSSGEAIATHSRFENKIRLNTDQSMKLARAFATGDATTRGGAEAVGTLTHELLHGSSHTDFFYERAKLASRPHAAMEESTTEILAFHYSGQVAKELGMRFNPLPTPLFSMSTVTDRPYTTTSTSYSRFVTRFAESVAFIEGHTKKSTLGVPVADQRARDQMITDQIFSYAAAVKPMRGSMRYRYLADRYLEKRGVPRHTVAFNEARNAIAGHLQKFLGFNKKGGTTYVSPTKVGGADHFEKMTKAVEREAKKALKSRPAYQETEFR